MRLQAASAASVIVTVAYMASLQCLLAGPGNFLLLQDSLLVFGPPSADSALLNSILNFCHQ